MGICFGSPSSEKPQDSFDASNILVGTAKRFYNDADSIDSIKPERHAMAALEMLAELETIYRRRNITFQSTGDLNFTHDENLHTLRLLLDEPLGRYYLGQFCTAYPEYSDLSNFLHLWRAIHLLDKVELTIQDVQKLQDIEKEAAAKESEDSRTGNLSGNRISSFKIKGPNLSFFRISGRLTSRFEEVKRKSGNGGPELELIAAAEPEDNPLLEVDEKKDGDDKKREEFLARREKNKGAKFTVSMIESEEYNSLAEDNISVAAGIKERTSEDVKGVLRDATRLVHNYLTEDASSRVDPSYLLRANTLRVDESKAKRIVQQFTAVSEDTIRNYKASLNHEDANKLRKEIFKNLENQILRVINATTMIEVFKTHSEWQRYQEKYKKVYNFVCHKDFDYMQTLGKGSFGRVIRVRKKTTKTQYALKVMSKKKILSGAEREQAAIEKEVLLLCFSSENVVGLKFAFQTSRALFIALDLLQGGTLTDAMHRGNEGKLSTQQVRTIAAQIIMGLNHLHLHGILYRDLKPVNIMLNEKGKAVLTDMGLCAKYRICLFDDKAKADMGEEDKVVDEDLILPLNPDLIKRKEIEKFYRILKSKNKMSILKKKDLKCVGTPGYRAPELLAITSSSEMRKKANKKGFVPNRNGYGHEVDYWALGVTLYFLVSGLYPFRSRAKINLFGPVPDMKSNEIAQQKTNYDFLKEFPDDQHFGSLLNGMLTKDPKERLGHDIKVLQRHPFFVQYDYENQEYLEELPSEVEMDQTWRKIFHGEIQGTYQPKIKKRPENEKPKFKGLSDAMRQFAQENVLELFGGADNDMIDDFKNIRTKHQKYFHGWDYIPDDLLQKDWALLEKYFAE